MSGVPTFVSNRLAELPACLNGPEGQAWARALGAIQQAELPLLRAAALARLPRECPDDALDLVGGWVDLQRYQGEANGTADPPTGYRGRIAHAFAEWARGGSVGGIVKALNDYGIPDVAIQGDVNWPNSWWSRFRVVLGSDFGAFAWTAGNPPTDEQKRQIRRIILKLKWAYSYPVDVEFAYAGDPHEFFTIGPLISYGFVIGSSRIGGFNNI